VVVIRTLYPAMTEVAADVVLPRRDEEDART
jgi:hypothetical protein